MDMLAYTVEKNIDLFLCQPKSKYIFTHGVYAQWLLGFGIGEAKSWSNSQSQRHCIFWPT